MDSPMHSPLAGLTHFILDRIRSHPNQCSFFLPKPDTLSASRPSRLYASQSVGQDDPFAPNHAFLEVHLVVFRFPIPSSCKTLPQ